MTTASLTIYRVNHSPVRMDAMDLGHCLRTLLPYLVCCSRSGRASEEIAALEMSNGATIRFACREGVIEVARQQPLIDKSRHPILGSLPFLGRIHTGHCPDENQLKRWVTEELSGVFDREALARPATLSMPYE